MSDYALFFAIWAAFCVGLTLGLLTCEHLYGRLTEQLHRQRADSDRAIVGDVPFVPADLKVSSFHGRKE